MMITKFNRMIKNKWILGALAIIVCVLFVGGSYLTRLDQDDTAEDRRGEGRLYGEDITRAEFGQALAFALELRQDVSLTPEQHDILRRHVWKRMAMLRTADRLGLAVSEEEVAEAIRRDRSFWVNERYSEDRYRKTIRSYLRSYRDPEALYWEYQRQDILLRKTMAILESATWVAPFDLALHLRQELDSLEAEYALFPETNFTETVTITAKDAEEYFEDNKAGYRVPEKVRIAYVAFPISNYFDRVEVDEDRVEEYYEEHRQDYVITATNGTNDVVSTQQLAEVKSDIETILKESRATLEARAAATLVGDRAHDVAGTGDLRALITVASAAGLSVATSELFAADEDVPGIESSYQFHTLAFRLDPSNAAMNVSEAVILGNSAYLMTSLEKQPSFIPEYAAVSNEVMPVAQSHAQHEAFLAKTESVREQILTAIAAEKTFTEALTGLDINVATTAPFSAMEGLSTNEPMALNALLPQARLMQPGEVSQVIETDDGALLAYISSRTPSNFGNMQWFRQRAAGGQYYYRSSALFSDWGDYLLTKANFEDYRKPRADTKETD